MAERAVRLEAMKRCLIERDMAAVEAVVGKSLWEDPWFFAALVPSDGRLQHELCPVTGYACEGDLYHLCEEFGCARKGGLSPRSEENF